jgi:mannose-1-phosphate guanylyltransferase/mannose-6-phosphate isomerase
MSEYEDTPWGYNKVLVWGQHFLIQDFIVKEACRTSLHLHENKVSFWFIESGNGELSLEDELFFLGPGDSVFIDKEQTHRLTASLGDMRVIEVQSGVVDDPEDVIRFEDDYGRVSEGLE